MNVLDLFSGIGGFSLGLERAGMRTVAFCEIDPYCRAVLRKHWPDVPIYEDVRELRWKTESGNRAHRTMQTSEKRRKPARNAVSDYHADTVQLNLLSPRVSQDETRNIADGNVEPQQCEGATGRTLAAGNGCTVGETQIGKTATDMSAIGDIGVRKSVNGGDGSSLGMGISVSIVGSSQGPRVNSMLTTSNHGPITPNSGSTSTTESPYVSHATNQFMPEIDVLTAGFPCQPASHAGKRRGTEDDRWLWPEIVRIVRDSRPTWIILENVYGLLTLQNGLVFEQCMVDLETLGYETQTFDIPACAVDAPHRRARLWIVAHAGHAEPPGRDETPDRTGHGRDARREPAPSGGTSGSGEYVADAEGDGSDGIRQSGSSGQGREAGRRGGESGNMADTDQPRLSDGGQAGQPQDQDERSGGLAQSESERRSGAWWLPEPDVGRVADGIPSRVDRLRALGNAVVPQVVETIGRAIVRVS